MAMAELGESVKIAACQTAHWLELEALVNFDWMSMLGENTKHRLELSAVVKQRVGNPTIGPLRIRMASPISTAQTV